MRIYWYWPFVHREDIVVPAAVPRDGDELVLHTMAGRLDRAEGRTTHFRIEPTLAAVGDANEGSPRWALARASTYGRRVVQRHRLLRQERADICHVVFLNYFTDWFDLRLVARRRRLVFEVHDVVPHQSRVPAAIERRALSAQYNSPGIIIVRHEYVRDRLVEEFGVDSARVKVVPWHVPDLGIVARTDFGDCRTVLFFGALRRNKGVDVLLESIAQLRDRSDLRFVFAGRGFADVEDGIRNAASNDPRIVFEAGFVSAERKHELYSAADLVVLPYTEFSSTSAVLCDAYSYRVPVVATEVGALGRTVREDSTGWVVAPRDAAALTAAIDAALANGHAWARAATAMARVSADRSPTAIAGRVREIYDEAIGR